MRPSKRFDRLRIDWFAAAGSGMRDRLELLRTLREARWPLTATLGTALLLQALLPAATAVTMAVLVGTLEQHGGTAGLFGRYRRAAPWRVRRRHAARPCRRRGSRAAALHRQVQDRRCPPGGRRAAHRVDADGCRPGTAAGAGSDPGRHR